MVLVSIVEVLSISCTNLCIVRNRPCYYHRWPRLGGNYALHWIAKLRNLEAQAIINRER